MANHATVTNYEEFLDYFRKCKTPMTFHEIENDKNVIDVVEKLPEYLQTAEESEQIISQSLGSTRCSVYVYNNHRKSLPQKPISRPLSRLNLPFRSPVISQTKIMTAPLASHPAPQPASPSHSHESTNFKDSNTSSSTSATITINSTPKSLHTMSKTLQRRFFHTDQSKPTCTNSSAQCDNCLIDAKRSANNCCSIPELESKLQRLDEDILLLSDVHDENDLELHIKALHEYNEIKDIGQLLMGKVAESLGTTTEQLYSKYSLKIED